MIEDQSVSSDGVDGALSIDDFTLSHAVADDLAAAEFYFLNGGAKIFSTSKSASACIRLSSTRTCQHRRRGVIFVGTIVS